MCKADYTENVKLAILWSVIKLKNRVQELRKQRRLSQSELADAVEVTRQTIISLENGKYNASLMLAHKIARYFDLTIEEVFLFEEDE
ncbi:DNA-binding helix-turn-helix protein [Holdemania filiformis DSM 12042]|uniref:DNA-binding helix-turn-helix protein n=1 Tax=Holdemania filiformis DSM 12042 TaxID=545696 RepID=B9YEE3_9FIRM|nr:DNA-binding helix-turn-helix protein [Holdemania filiformis DSM 12042]